jgi:hypothetical protein
MKNKYRIVSDGYAGYEAQVKRWWLPFWVQIGFTNTSSSVERARVVCDNHANKFVEIYEPPIGRSGAGNSRRW